MRELDVREMELVSGGSDTAFQAVAAGYGGDVFCVLPGFSLNQIQCIDG